MFLDSFSICLKLPKVDKLLECNLNTAFIIPPQGIAEWEPKERLAVNEQYWDHIYFLYCYIAR